MFIDYKNLTWGFVEDVTSKISIGPSDFGLIQVSSIMPNILGCVGNSHHYWRRILERTPVYPCQHIISFSLFTLSMDPVLLSPPHVLGGYWHHARMHKSWVTSSWSYIGLVGSAGTNVFWSRSLLIVKQKKSSLDGMRYLVLTTVRKTRPLDLHLSKQTSVGQLGRCPRSQGAASDWSSRNMSRAIRQFERQFDSKEPDVDDSAIQ